MIAATVTWTRGEQGADLSFSPSGPTGVVLLLVSLALGHLETKW